MIIEDIQIFFTLLARVKSTDTFPFSTIANRLAKYYFNYLNTLLSGEPLSSSKQKLLISFLKYFIDLIKSNLNTKSPSLILPINHSLNIQDMLSILDKIESDIHNGGKELLSLEIADEDRLDFTQEMKAVFDTECANNLTTKTHSFKLKMQSGASPTEKLFYLPKKTARYYLENIDYISGKNNLYKRNWTGSIIDLTTAVINHLEKKFLIDDPFLLEVYSQLGKAYFKLGYNKQKVILKNIKKSSKAQFLEIICSYQAAIIHFKKVESHVSLSDTQPYLPELSACHRELATTYNSLAIRYSLEKQPQKSVMVYKAALIEMKKVDPLTLSHCLKRVRSIESNLLFLYETLIQQGRTETLTLEYLIDSLRILEGRSLISDKSAILTCYQRLCSNLHLAAMTLITQGKSCEATSLYLRMISAIVGMKIASIQPIREAALAVLYYRLAVIRPDSNKIFYFSMSTYALNNIPMQNRTSLTWDLHYKICDEILKTSTTFFQQYFETLTYNQNQMLETINLLNTALIIYMLIPSQYRRDRHAVNMDILLTQLSVFYHGLGNAYFLQMHFVISQQYYHLAISAFSCMSSFEKNSLELLNLYKQDLLNVYTQHAYQLRILNNIVCVINRYKIAVNLLSDIVKHNVKSDLKVNISTLKKGLYESYCFFRNRQTLDFEGLTLKNMNGCIELLSLRQVVEALERKTMERYFSSLNLFRVKSKNESKINKKQVSTITRRKSI